MAEKFRNQVRLQNGQVIDLAILKPGFELARPFQNRGRFQNGQVNNLAVSKRPGFQNGREQLYELLHWDHLGSVNILHSYLKCEASKELCELSAMLKQLNRNYRLKWARFDLSFLL